MSAPQILWQTNRAANHFRWNMLHLLTIAALLICVVGCANHNDAEENLGTHDVVITKSRQWASVVKTGSSEKNFDDQQLLGILEPLRQLPNIKALDISETSVTDRSVSQLKSVPSLELINVIDTAVTKDGLVALKGMPNLHFLLVDGERLSEADLDAIQNELPDVQLVVKKRLGPTYPFRDKSTIHKRPVPS